MSRECEEHVFSSHLLLPPPLMPAGWLFWMRLDLLTLVLMGEAPGSWPGLMGLAGSDAEIMWITFFF